MKDSGKKERQPTSTLLAAIKACPVEQREFAVPENIFPSEPKSFLIT